MNTGGVWYHTRMMYFPSNRGLATVAGQARTCSLRATSLGGGRHDSMAGSSLSMPAIAPAWNEAGVIAQVLEGLLTCAGRLAGQGVNTGCFGLLAELLVRYRS